MSKSKKMAKGKNRLAPPTTSTDLVLTNQDGVLILTISPNANWAGIQQSGDTAFAADENDMSVLNRNYSTPPGDGKKEALVVPGPGYYRGWTSDFDYNIHFSNVIQVS